MVSFVQLSERQREKEVSDAYERRRIYYFWIPDSEGSYRFKCFWEGTARKRLRELSPLFPTTALPRRVAPIGNRIQGREIVRQN